MKKQKLTIKIIAIGCILILACGCEKKCQYKKPPPGYKILYNQDSTKFIAVMPGGTKLGESKSYPEKAFKSYDEALYRAWYQYNFLPATSEIDTIKWLEYERSLE